MKTKDINERIDKINHYIGIASKLDEIVDDTQVEEIILKLVDNLKEVRSYYVQAEADKVLNIRDEAKLDQLLAQYAYNFFDGDFKKAEKDLRKDWKGADLTKWRDREIREAQIHDELMKTLKIDEDAASKILEFPEAIPMMGVEILRQRYGNGLV